MLGSATIRQLVMVGIVLPCSHLLADTPSIFDIGEGLSQNYGSVEQLFVEYVATWTQHEASKELSQYMSKEVKRVFYQVRESGTVFGEVYHRYSERERWDNDLFQQEFIISKHGWRHNYPLNRLFLEGEASEGALPSEVFTDPVLTFCGMWIVPLPDSDLAWRSANVLISDEGFQQGSIQEVEENQWRVLWNDGMDELTVTKIDGRFAVTSRSRQTPDGDGEFVEASDYHASGDLLWPTRVERRFVSNGEVKASAQFRVSAHASSFRERSIDEFKMKGEICINPLTSRQRSSGGRELLSDQANWINNNLSRHWSNVESQTIGLDLRWFLCGCLGAAVLYGSSRLFRSRR